MLFDQAFLLLKLLQLLYFMYHFSERFRRRSDQLHLGQSGWYLEAAVQLRAFERVSWPDDVQERVFIRLLLSLPDFLHFSAHQNIQPAWLAQLAQFTCADINGFKQIDHLNLP